MWKIVFFVVVISAGIMDLFAQHAAQSTPDVRPASNSESYYVMWVILGIWFAVSLYLFFIDRKISRLEKKHKND